MMTTPWGDAMVRFHVSAVAMALLLPMPAQAAPVTYACSLVHGARQPGMYGEVDQVVIDLEAKVIDLRVAKTMGTLVPINWIFTTRTGYDGEPAVIVMDQQANGDIIAAGWDGSGSYSFKFTDGNLLFGATYLAPALAFTWQCRE